MMHRDPSRRKNGNSVVFRAARVSRNVRVHPIPRVMTSDANAEQPFTLWFETLPSGDTARLLIWPRPEQVRVVLFWNRAFHSVRGFTTRETAEAWGHSLHDALQRDALAGALLGYDDEVLDRLQAQCAV